MNTRQRAQPTGTNRPTQTHPHPPPHPRAKTHKHKGGDQTPGKHTASTIRPTTNPPTTTHQPPQPHHNNHHNHTTTTRQQPHHDNHDTHPTTDPSAATAGRTRPDPSRTRKLRPPAPMVLRPPGRGRAGHHRAHTTPPPPTQNDGRGKTNNNTTTPDQETCHRLTGRLIQKQIPPQPKDHIHVPGQARQSVALPQCTFSW